MAGKSQIYTKTNETLLYPEKLGLNTCSYCRCVKTVVLANMKELAITAPTIHFFKVNNKNTRIMCEICLKLAIKTLERRH